MSVQKKSEFKIQKERISFHRNTLEFLMTSEKVKAHDMAFYMVLKAYSDEHDVLKLSITQLQKMMGLSRPALMTKLVRLKRLGLIRAAFRVEAKGKIIGFNNIKKAKAFITKDGGRFTTTQYKILEPGVGGGHEH